MKKAWIIVLAIGVLAGAALSVFVMWDGTVSIPEAAAVLAFLTAARFVGMKAIRSIREIPEEKNPSAPLKVLDGGKAAQSDPARKPAA
ncbi:MAG: hypothetical protein IJL26_08640 [Clostridia bacterium]|nr:hypothetical protein [Clostridia bacterium]